jgi:glycosyltransferase involved in cell wall biosynthesis
MLFRPGDSAELASRLLGLARDPGRRAALGAQAKRYVETERSWAANAKAYEAVYSRLAGQA